MASREETEKEKTIAVFSTKVSSLVSKIKYVDHELFKVSMICSATKFNLKTAISTLLETSSGRSGRCVFHKPTSSGWLVYLSEYPETYLMRILSLKAFW